MIDDAIVKTFGRLKDLGLAENTIVIFTTDHGDYMGGHQISLRQSWIEQVWSHIGACKGNRLLILPMGKTLTALWSLRKIRGGV